MGLSCRTFSLGHVLIDCTLGGAVGIFHDDREAVAADNRDDVRQRASRRLLRRILRREIASWYVEPLCTTDGSTRIP